MTRTPPFPRLIRCSPTMGEEHDVRELQAKLKAAEQEMEVGESARAGLIDGEKNGC